MLTVPGGGRGGGRGGISSRGGPARGGGVGPIRGRGGGGAGRTLLTSSRPPPGSSQGPPSRALLPTPPIGNKVRCRIAILHVNTFLIVSFLLAIRDRKFTMKRTHTHIYIHSLMKTHS